MSAAIAVAVTRAWAALPVFGPTYEVEGKEKAVFTLWSVSQRYRKPSNSLKQNPH